LDETLKVKLNETQVMYYHYLDTSALTGFHDMKVLSAGRIGIWSVFEERGKPDGTRRKPSKQDEDGTKTNSTYM